MILFAFYGNKNFNTIKNYIENKNTNKEDILDYIKWNNQKISMYSNTFIEKLEQSEKLEKNKIYPIYFHGGNIWQPLGDDQRLDNALSKDIPNIKIINTILEDIENPVTIKEGLRIIDNKEVNHSQTVLTDLEKKNTLRIKSFLL